MKKNRLFLLGLAIVFAAFLSLSLVSNTFAKYVSTDQGFDSARVAKWGVTVTAFDEQFAESYDGTVLTSNTQKLVAPGTEMEVAGIVISGKPEVSVKVEATADLELEGWADSNGFYCPLKFEVAGQTVDTSSAQNAEDFEGIVENAIINSLKIDSAAPNYDLTKTVSVKWSWAYEGNNDASDTYLGNLAAEGSAPAISLAISCTVTQID